MSEFSKTKKGLLLAHNIKSSQQMLVCNRSTASAATVINPTNYPMLTHRGLHIKHLTPENEDTFRFYHRMLRFAIFVRFPLRQYFTRSLNLISNASLDLRKAFDLMFGWNRRIGNLESLKNTFGFSGNRSLMSTSFNSITCLSWSGTWVFRNSKLEISYGLGRLLGSPLCW